MWPTRCASPRSTRPWLPRAWSRPNTWWTRPTSARTTSSPPASGTASTRSAPRGRTRAGRTATARPSAPATSRWTGTGAWRAARRARRAPVGRCAARRPAGVPPAIAFQQAASVVPPRQGQLGRAPPVRGQALLTSLLGRFFYLTKAIVPGGPPSTPGVSFCSMAAVRPLGSGRPAGPPALGAVRPRRRGLRRRRRPAGEPGHVGLRAEQAGEQGGDRQVDVERLPAQAGAGA
jgi:hypothetical protein